MNKKERHSIYKAMLEREGKSSRVSKAIEELSELVIELSKYTQLNGYNRQKVCDEIADSKIAIEWLEEMFAPTDSTIDTIVDFKLKRTRDFYITSRKLSPVIIDPSVNGV